MGPDAPTHPEQLIGRSAVDVNGAEIGKVGQVYLDDESGQPVWVTVHTGSVGARDGFAPLHGSSFDGNELRLAVTADLVRAAPGVDVDGHLGDEETDALHQHYGGHLGAGHGWTGDGGAVGHDTSGPTTDDDAMIRSRERVSIGTERVDGGRARLRKYVVTEQVDRTLPLRHEEVRIVREPITDANRARAAAGGDLTSEEFVLILHAERPVVAKEIVPVERVWLATETVTEQREVSTTLREERIEETVELFDEVDHRTE